MAEARISSDVLDSVVTGVNLVPGSLRDQLDPGSTLLVFLRQFGCIFCRETLAELRRAVEESPDSFPRPLFFFMGSPTEGRLFLRRLWPEVRAVSDPEKRFYQAFGVERGGLRQMFGPGVWAAHRRARAQGFGHGPRLGDIWMMPGVFWVEDEVVVWSHHYAHAGDSPDFARIPELAGRAAASK